MEADPVEDVEDRVLVWPKTMYDGCGSIEEMAQRAEQEAKRLRELDEEGYRMAPVFGTGPGVELWKDGNEHTKEEVFEEVTEQADRLSQSHEK